MPFETYPILVARALAATPTVFTTIAELDTVSLPELGVTDTDASVQNTTMDRYVVSTLMRRKPVTLSLNFLPYDASHDNVTGLLKAQTGGTFDGYKFTHTASSLIWVASGYVTNVKLKTAKEGVLGADVTLRFSGQMTIQGLTVGT
jgi:hypothetical protein